MDRKNIISFILLVLMAFVTGCFRPGSTSKHKQQKEHTPLLNQSLKERYTENSLKMTEFIDYAMSVGIMELQLVDIVLEKAKSPDVKNLTRTIKSDYERANSKLEELIITNRWGMPDRMSDEHKQAVAQFSNTGRVGFDTQYLRFVEQTHQNTINVFNIVADTQDASGQKDEWHPELLEWVKNTLPVLKRHLEMSQELLGQKKNQSAT